MADTQKQAESAEARTLHRRRSTGRALLLEVDEAPQGEVPASQLAVFSSGFIAASSAEATTLPLDTAKVRMQLDTSRQIYKSPLQTMRLLLKQEGVTALWGGLPAGILRCGTMYAVRLGLYDHVLQKVAEGVGRGNKEEALTWISTKLVAAVPVSAISVCFANPFDVLKVRFQRSTSVYKTSSVSLATISNIIRSEGFFAGLYSGFLPNITRNCTVGGAELVGYYQSKQMLMKVFNLNDDTPTHVSASFAAALSAAVIGSPFDVLGTRLMQSDAVSGGKGPIAFATRMLRTEGISGFYKGFVMNLLRLWSFNLVLWLSFENSQKAMLRLGL